MEAEEVTIIVVSASNLPVKRAGRCKFSVVFGVKSKESKQKFRTSVVKEPSGNPQWKEESAIQVKNPRTEYVFFLVTEKDEIVGELTVPIVSLTQTDLMRKVPLRPHKKSSVVQGELCFHAYISKVRSVDDIVNPQIRGSSGLQTGQVTGLRRFRQTLGLTPAPLRHRQRDSGSENGDDKKRNTFSFFNKKLSKSLHDIFHIGRSNHDEDEEEESPVSLTRSGLAGSLNNLRSELPHINNIIPNMATVHGGTKLCLEGRNLGLGKSDIRDLMVCDVDLMDTIEWESSNRIYVTTKATTAGRGDLLIETGSGGTFVAKSVFTFVDRTAEKTGVIRNGSLERQTSPLPVIITHSPDKELPQPSPKATPRAQRYQESLKSDVADVDFSKLDDKPPPTVHRSSSQNQQDTHGHSLLPRGSATLPRVKSTTDLDPDAQNSPEPPGRFRKNHQKHTRRASESVVALQRTPEDRDSEFAKEKAELQKEIVRLMRENEGLHKQNEDLNIYIQDLVAKVMEHCPEVLVKMPTKK